MLWNVAEKLMDSDGKYVFNIHNTLPMDEMHGYKEQLIKIE